MTTALLILLLTLGTAGTSISAQNSLPGDVLYPIKININESVESLFAIGSKSDAQVHLNQAERRLKEAEQLTKENKLTNELEIKLKDEFSSKADDVNKDIQDLISNGDTEIANYFSDELKNKINNQNIKLDGDTIKKIESIKIEKQNISDKKNESDVTSKTVKTINLKKDIKENDDDGEENEGDEDGEDRTSNKAFVASPSNIPNTTVSQKSFTITEVSTHKDSQSCYTTVDGGVYDLTSFIGSHPGGSSAILKLCGKDGSSMFNAQHGGQGRPVAELASLKIGILK